MKAVIVGAGQAGGQLAHSLRVNGWSGSITMIGEESWFPYQRPPLSKQLLAGESGPEEAFLYDSAFYDEADIEVRTNARVTRIDRERTHVELESGDTVKYDYLALTTGARVRRLAMPGSDLRDIFYFRDMDDALALRKRFKSARRMVIVGGGYIGLEVAAAAAKSGLDVTVVELADRVMSRVVSPIVSEYFEGIHKANGVHVLTGVGVHGFAGAGSVSEVLTDQGPLRCDLAMIGVGILPQTALAEACGLPVDDGVVVDAYAQTADERIFAAGDCTQHPNAVYGRRLRLECVQNASDQADIAAQTICGNRTPYQAVPWFWSDQYDTKLKIAGVSQGYDQVVRRGDPGTGQFANYYLRNQRLIAVDAVNSPRDYMMGKRLIANQATPDPAKIADVSIPVKTLGD
jgi:3-phenylpropionate/trans-cinnamate dioxygenase ferredoxin reductase subunit